LSEKLMIVKENSEFTKTAADGLTQTIKFIGDEAAIATYKLSTLGKDIDAWKQIVMAVGDYRDIAAAWENWKNVQDEIAEGQAKIRSGMTDLLTGASGFASRFNAVIDGDMQSAAKHVDDFLAAMVRLQGILTKPAPTMGLEDENNALK